MPPETPYQAGDQVNWIGTARLFCRQVTIANVHFEHFITLNLPDVWCYDLADPATGKILLFSAHAEELEPIGSDHA
jgi:hypothetical protein